ncbi:MAG: DUF4410 domain-containing protein [Chthoniobacterales bacterium]|nr:DUF4410 domain-containing protein [Chthoniobacterales bacterium]
MRTLLLLILAMFCTGCSSVSVLDERESAHLAPASRPANVWVRPFEMPRHGEFDASPAPGEQDARARIGRAVAEGFLSKSDSLIAPGHLLEPGAAVPGDGLLVEGKVLRVQQGSRVLRLGIGFGAGRSLFETSVRVYSLGKSKTEPWLSFETSGGSNMEPGLAGMLVPSPVAIPVAVSLVGGTVAAGALGVKGVSQDAARTGRTAAAQVHEKLALHGLVKSKVRAKKSGRVPTPVGEIPFPSIE